MTDTDSEILLNLMLSVKSAYQINNKENNWYYLKGQENDLSTWSYDLFIDCALTSINLSEVKQGKEGIFGFDGLFRQLSSQKKEREAFRLKKLLLLRKHYFSTGFITFNFARPLFQSLSGMLEMSCFLAFLEWRHKWLEMKCIVNHQQNDQFNGNFKKPQKWF